MNIYFFLQIIFSMEHTESDANRLHTSLNMNIYVILTWIYRSANQNLQPDSMLQIH